MMCRLTGGGPPLQRRPARNDSLTVLSCVRCLGGPLSSRLSQADTLVSIRFVTYFVSEIKPNQVRLGEHSDYCTMSLVFQRDAGGLQVNFSPFKLTHEPRCFQLFFFSVT